jgi:hypothetical protein
MLVWLAPLGTLARLMCGISIDKLLDGAFLWNEGEAILNCERLMPITEGLFLCGGCVLRWVCAL